MKYHRLLPLVLFAFLIFACTKDGGNDLGTPGGNNGGGSNADVSLNQKGTGTSSADLLSDNVFKSMVIELVHVEGFEPTQVAQDRLVAFFQARTNKPNGITIEVRSIPSPGGSPYTNAEIVAIEDANRTKYNSGDQIAVWAFFADGESAANTGSGKVLGTAYRNTSFVVYEATIHDLSNSALEPNRSVLESTVTHHEIGHILGLTNLGAPLQSSHEDGTHAKHCNVEECLMYWAAETGSGIDNLIGLSSPPALDAQCIADLRANGGK